MTPVFLFDIGNVLIDFDLRGLQQKIADESSVPYRVIRATWENENFLGVETGRLSGRLYFRRLLDSVPLPWNYEDWIRAWMNAYSPNLAGQTLFADLKNKGHSVCMLSNLAEYNKEAIERKFPEFFDQSTRNFFSYEMGFHKPDIRIYLAACQSLDVDPGDCVFLDDSTENVAGARRIGMRGYVFSTEEFPDIVRKIEEGIEA
jgi:FMN phosphatase YigB (HAD superfamily)